MAKWVVSHYKCSKCGELDSDKTLEGSLVLVTINCFNCHGIATMNLKSTDPAYESSGYEEQQELSGISPIHDAIEKMEK
jgi:hypothetical protein